MNTLNTPADYKAIRAALDQISESYTKIATEKAQVKDIFKALEDKFKLPKKTLRTVAKLYYRQTVVEFETETSEVKSIYKSITS